MCMLCFSARSSLSPQFCMRPTICEGRDQLSTKAGPPSLQGGAEGFSKMIYPQDVAEAALMVVKTSFNCCPTQIWLEVRSPFYTHAAAMAFACESSVLLYTCSCSRQPD